MYFQVQNAHLTSEKLLVPISVSLCGQRSHTTCLVCLDLRDQNNSVQCVHVSSYNSAFSLLYFYYKEKKECLTCIKKQICAACICTEKCTRESGLHALNGDTELQYFAFTQLVAVHVMYALVTF